MKIEVIIFLALAMALCLCSSALGAQTDFLGASSLEIDLSIKTQVGLIYERETGFFDWLTINQTFFPTDNSHQTVEHFSTSPTAEIGEDVLFKFDSPNSDKLNTLITASVKTKHTDVPITTKVKFPVVGVAGSLVKYTQSYEHIDSDDAAVIAKANELARGEDDLYVVVYNIAEWIQENVKYSISTLTSDVNQKASWVLENKYGVCDEITTLFIAMLRAVGVPARYVSGLAYTDHELLDKGFGPHGWAEVWFPDYGWVPFDLTYDEYGFIDATHVIMDTSIDSGESSTYFQWLGNFVDVEPSRTTFDAEVVDVGQTLSTPLKLSMEFLDTEVGFGSWNIVTVKIKNPESRYVAMTLFPIKSQGIISGYEKRRLLLMPLEEKEVLFPFQVDSGMDPAYRYIFTMGFYTSTNNTVTGQIRSAANYANIPKDEVDAIIKRRGSSVANSAIAQLNVTCSVESDKVFIDTNQTVVCNVKNIGNLPIESAKICQATTCQEIVLPISKSQEVSFLVEPKGVGSDSVLVDAIVSDQGAALPAVSAVARFEVLDRPDFDIVGLVVPSSPKYGEQFQITFKVNKTSYSGAKDMAVSIIGRGFNKTWKFDDMSDGKDFAINVNGAQYVEKNEENIIRVVYHDLDGIEYVEEERFNVNLSPLKPMQKLDMASRKLELIIRSRPAVAYGIIAASVFLALMGFVWSIKTRKNTP